jgi:hypothetical protein
MQQRKVVKVTEIIELPKVLEIELRRQDLDGVACAFVT